MKTTLTFEISGRVKALDLREGIILFERVVSGLTPPRSASWLVDETRAGGGAIALRGESDDPAVLERIEAQYEKVGLTLSQNRTPSHADGMTLTVMAAARDVLALVERVDWIKMGTRNRTHLIRHRESPRFANPTGPTSLGGVTGLAQSLNGDGGLTLTVRENLVSKPVECFFEPEYEETIREAWGKRVTVYGTLESDSMTGLPRFVRDAKKVVILPEVEPGAYKKARGAIPWKPGDMPAEEAIRRVRDA